MTTTNPSASAETSNSQPSESLSDAPNDVDNGNDSQNSGLAASDDGDLKKAKNKKKKAKKKDKEKKTSKAFGKRSKQGDEDSITPAVLPSRESATSISSDCENGQLPVEKVKKPKSKKLTVAETSTFSAVASKSPKKKGVQRSHSSEVSDMKTTKLPSALSKPASLPNICEFGNQQGVIEDASSGDLKDSKARRKSKSKARKDVKKELQMQEQKIIKTNGAAVPVAASRKPPLPVKPGAYQIQGQAVARVETAALPPQERTDVRKSNKAVASINPVQRRPKSESLPGLEQAPAVVNGSATAPRGIVVAAALSSDVEANIEQEVRRRILSQAAKAQVVSVAHGVSLLSPQEEARRLADLRELHKPRGVRERLFGDARNSEVDIGTSPESIRKRNFLKWTVKRNQATNMWVSTVQTKQKAVEQNNLIEVERSSVGFSATTQQEAFETGLANAVPIMQPTTEHPICFVCKAKFALFRRPQHCRNCGVCVCSNCTTQWPNSMFPETFNARTMNNVCHACDWLADSFRTALLEGDYSTALYIYATGNINIRCSLGRDKKVESM